MLDIRARLHGLRHRCTLHTARRRGERLGGPGGPRLGRAPSAPPSAHAPCSTPRPSLQPGCPPRPDPRCAGPGGCSASCPGRVCHCRPHRPPPPSRRGAGRETECGAARRAAPFPSGREPARRTPSIVFFKKCTARSPSRHRAGSIPRARRPASALLSDSLTRIAARWRPAIIERLLAGLGYYRTGLVPSRAPLAARLLLRRWPRATPLVREGRAGPGRAVRALAGLWRPGHRSNLPCVGGAARQTSV